MKYQLNIYRPLLTRLLCETGLAEQPRRFKTPTAHGTAPLDSPKWINIDGQSYLRDSFFNIPSRILSLTGRSLHNRKCHPLCLVKQRIADFMFKQHARRLPDGVVGSPLFSLHDTISPVVTTRQNFDSLLIPPDHPSRSPTDTYYINENTLLRSHTSAHQLDFMNSGLNAFLLVGDVYRRDEVDALHYPVFHQLEGVRLFSANELFKDAIDPSGCLQLLEEIPPSSVYAQKEEHPLHVFPSYMLPPDRQPRHTNETAKRLEFELKTVLQALAKSLFGPGIQMRWVEAYFPFTHPSWELEVKTRVGYREDGVEEWTELLGCGLMRQELLDRAGISNKVGYAFGLGLERWAMQLYNIPDIRLFWTEDTGFLHQFETDDIFAQLTYKPVSIFPQCVLDLSFWLSGAHSPATKKQVPSESKDFNTNEDDASKAFEHDFYDLVRNVAGDLIEQVRLIDRFTDAKTGRTSHCYRLVYRDQHRTLTLDEVRPLHERIAQEAASRLGVQVR
ncbi:phenylalanyl-tRNA synthetase alpha chain [Clonorchis sinensis]|uniref:phenylalanine--tRNA ligase n=2 Tax=Clonorchis sinensis TaxID=79923 RepID=G7YJ18_CLOSI|nr:phenylalanyl-tRNA synthetase alpha chain [Clonorchis sinensis]